MNKLFYLVLPTLFFIQSANSVAQTRAVTEKGDTIFVYANGTWSYEFEEITNEVNEFDFLNLALTVDTIATKQVFSPNAKSEVKSEIIGFKVKYDDKKWKRVPPGGLNADADFAFEFKSADVWCIIIDEETSFSPENLFRIAKRTMENNLNATTEILKTQVVNVNGTNLFRGVIKAQVSGISFVFDSYYYSNELGSVQFTTWTSDNLWKKYERDITELLNGFIAK